MNTYYLNNNGSRWVVVDNNNKRVQMTFSCKSGAKVTRRVKYFESFGNFGLCAISWKGKLIKVFPDTLLVD
jgi:hypothetical protein